MVILGYRKDMTGSEVTYDDGWISFGGEVR